MVQKKAKAPIKLSSQTSSVAAARDALVQPEKSFHFASHHLSRQDAKRKGGGGGEIKKKMVVRRRGAIQQVDDDDDLKSLPNYMKPTSSSGARKKQLKLSATSPSSCFGSKPAKILVIKLCLKLVRVPSIKKTQGSGCCNQKKAVNRATCSSTQKDNKFPKTLDLNPGGTEAEGTSVKKVCPYNYCSLNGHWHEPLLPLKSFLSAIRQSFKTEQRMKPKKKEIDTGHKVTGLKIQPLVEESGDDFFVEIYAKEQQWKVELVSVDQNRVQDDKKVVDEIHELEPRVVSTDNDIDDSSESSVDEMDGMMNLIEFVECVQVVKDDEEKSQQLTKSKDVAECSPDCCCIEHLRGNGTTGEGFTEDEVKCVLSEAIDHINLEEETSLGVGKYDDDRLGMFHYPSQEIEDVIDSLSVDSDDAFIISEIARVAHEVYEDVPDQKGESFSFDEDLEDSEEERQVCDVIESINENKLDAANNLIQYRLEHARESSEDQSDNLIVVEEEVSKSEEFSDQDLEDLIEQSVVKHGEERIASELLDQNMVVNGIQEVEDRTSGSVAQVSLTREQFSESYESTTDSDEECFEASDDKTDEEDEICLKDCAQRSEENKISSYTARITRARSLTKSSDKPKIRIRITRKERWEEAEMMREFNPRSPRFLPCNPDPDSEKVDLRHQMIDERKNAEEWMIDYALRQAVTKLSLARKRKVALLVEAFEKVVPLTIQACFPSFHFYFAVGY